MIRKVASSILATAVVLLALNTRAASADSPGNILHGLSSSHYWVQGCVKFANRTSKLAHVIYLGNDSPPQVIGGTTSDAPWVNADGENCQQRGDANDKDMFLGAFQGGTPLARVSSSLPVPAGFATLPRGIETLTFSWGDPGTNTPLVSVWLAVYRSCPPPWCPSSSLKQLQYRAPTGASH